ncbi:MAG: PEP-CTERM sorting domain-containing protein [Blastocatellales bacterium]
MTRFRYIRCILIMIALAACGRTFVLADGITYRQIRQSAQDPADQKPKAQESPTPPEFVRLPDGRIVKYGPGIICDENCVEPMTPVAFRETGPRLWWIAPPLVAGGVLCAILCRGGDEAPLTTPTVIVPTPSPTPGVSPTPPPTEIPEPGTIILVGIGLGALAVHKRRRSS